MAAKADFRRRWVLCFLAVGLLAILACSLWQRFQQPGLTVNRFAQSRPAASEEGADSGMAAIGRLMEQAARNPHDIPVLLRLTESLMAVGQWDSAENFAQKAMSETPGDNPTAMYLLAVIHHNKGNHAAAAELLEKLLAKQENPSARYSLAILYIHFLNRPEDGRLQLEKGINDENAPQPLVDAMQEELGKLDTTDPEQESGGSSTATPPGPLGPDSALEPESAPARINGSAAPSPATPEQR